MKDKEETSESLLSDYRKVDGIMFPYSIESRQAGASQGQTINIETVEINPKIDNTMFVMPAVTSAPTPAEEIKK